MGSPSAYLGLDQLVSEAVAFEFDRSIMRFGRWVENRMRETTGGKRPKPKYRTMGEVLGYDEEEMYSLDSEEVGSLADQYMADYILALERGEEPPDPEKYNLESDQVMY